jgi:sugar/nucleoside kinase (ribokinase family)
MIDVVLRIDEVPKSGGDVLASEHLTTTGGGYNAMSAWSRQGVRAVYAGRLGLGPFSSIARDALASDEIAAPIEADSSRDVGFCVAMIDATGERTFITSSGSEESLREADLASLDVQSADYVLVSGYNVMYLGQAEMVLHWLATLSADVVVAFDPSNRVADIPKANLDEVLDRADWVLCNEIEAATLTGATTIEESLEALALRTGRRGVVIRTGADGCRLLSHGQKRTLVGPFETTVLDTNGAGDTHSGVFLAELALGTDEPEAARRANAGAAVAIATLGPASCPPRGVITALLDEVQSHDALT